MSFEMVRALADAVLLEGYVLYPYRASSPKNQFRWTFGVLAPRRWSEAGGCERWWLRAQCLVEGDPDTAIEGRLRFMQLDRRQLEERGEAGYRPVAELEVDGELALSWDEGAVREIELDVTLGQAAAGVERAVSVAGGRDVEPLGAAARRVRQRWPIAGRALISAEPVEAGRPLWRLEIRIENLGEIDDLAAPRSEALRAAMLSTHILLRARGGRFMSLTDPPAWAERAAADCDNQGIYPVLAGSPDRRDLLLAAPIVLPDHAQIAPESEGDFFDATEIDALLSLRTATLTDSERREVRATDPRAAALLDRVDAMTPEVMQRQLGAIREFEVIGAPAEPPRDPRLCAGARVRLLQPRRRTDAQDFLLAGCTATIERVMQDVSGEHYLAVTIDDDPAAELYRACGRYHYYRTDEVELVSPAPEEP